jgi:two-component system response regulator FixJ
VSDSPFHGPDPDRAGGATTPLYVVDDDEAVRASLASLLRLRDDLAVSSFASGTEFLAHLPGLAPGLLVVDMHMPGATGLDVLHALAVRSRSMPTILITGQADNDLKLVCTRAGAIGFLEKPFDHRELFRLVDRGLQRLLE